MILGKMRLNGLRQRRLAELTAQGAKRRPADWSVKLTRTLSLKDGTKLVTLADARESLVKHFQTITQSALLALAMERVLTAAESRTFPDRKTATDHVAIALKRLTACRSPP